MSVSDPNELDRITSFQLYAPSMSISSMYFSLWQSLTRISYISKYKFLKVLLFLRKEHFFRQVANSMFKCHNPKELKLHLRFFLVLSYPREHKFKSSFQQSFNPFCICRKGEIETCCHYLLHCFNDLHERLDRLKSTRFFYITRKR